MSNRLGCIAGRTGVQNSVGIPGALAGDSAGLAG
jgi:hypothetical protein